jgi:hypothetical protein
MSATDICMILGMVLGDFISAAAVIVAIAAMRRATDVNVTNRTLSVHVTQQMHDQFASKPEFFEHVRDNDKQRGILHNRIDRAIDDYNEKFQALPNEIVALLRNTGNLK